jgi:FkbM family methyltransferase
MAHTLRARLRHAANTWLAPLGLHLVRPERTFEMTGLLARARARGWQAGTVIDVGASDGVWSRQARRFFPKAKYLLFEPLSERQAALERLRQTHGFDFVPAAAGAEKGVADFAIDPALDGSGVAAPGTRGTRSVPVEAIDDAVTTRRLPGPYLLKLDTHGFEIPVLTGANRVLAQTGLLIIETYNFTLGPGCLRFYELCAWLEARGFRCCDLADPMRRPRDGVLWQMDLAFMPKDSPLFTNNTYDWEHTL